MLQFLIMNSKSLCFFLLLCFFSSCVSNKKHKEALSLLQTQQETLLKQEVDQRDATISAGEKEVRGLELRLAERKGENNALTAMQDKLQNKIDLLEEEMESNSNQSLSNRQELKQKMKKKDKEISDLKESLQEVGAVLDRNQATMEQLANDLRYELQNYNPVHYEVARGVDMVIVNLPVDDLFKSKSTTRFQDNGVLLLEKISQVILRYPSMNVVVNGHSDNTPPPSRSYVDNWNFAGLRAASVVRVLTEEFDLNPSQLSAGSKGEFAPRASNADPEGQKRNRRIELRIAPRALELTKAIREQLGKQF